MKKKDFTQLVEQFIQVELKVADLYMFFSNAFPEDTDFWRELHNEEKRHASLIRNANLHLSRRIFPSELLVTPVQKLIEVNIDLTHLIKEYNEKPPSREVAFKTAINIEHSAGEFHFQQAMALPPYSRFMVVFQHLNKDDKDHAQRIHNYMNDKGIQ